VGCHGYAESAEIELERLRAMTPDRRWLLVSVQALNRFYRGSSEQVVAGWMTRQDREIAIADNIAYLHAAIEAAAGEWRASSTLVYSGFSQGVAMALRAAMRSPRPVTALLLSGESIPPEFGKDDLGRLPPLLVARGARDTWYTAAKYESDLVRLREAGVDITTLEFDGAHEWGAPLIDAGREFLARWL
jgi:predicted esterase